MALTDVRTAVGVNQGVLKVLVLQPQPSGREGMSLSDCSFFAGLVSFLEEGLICERREPSEEPRPVRSDPVRLSLAMLRRANTHQNERFQRAGQRSWHPGLEVLE